MINKFKTISISSISLIALAACNTLPLSLNEKIDHERVAPIIQQAPPEIKEVVKIVYVEKANESNANFCQTVCLPEELESQLIAFIEKPSPLASYQWLLDATKKHATEIQDKLKSLANEHYDDEAFSLIQGIFYSIPRTGYRDTVNALDNIRRFPIDYNSTENDSVFLKLITSNLEERKLLIEERSNLRKQTIALQAETENQREQAKFATNQLRKLKDIERSMLKGQNNAKQYKVLK